MASLAVALRLPLLLFRRPASRSQEKTSSAEDDQQENGHPTRLCSYEDLPKWYQDNAYIRTHYRPVSHSYNTCLHSLTYLHNETMNIYTHLIPALTLALALPLLQLNISRIYAHAPWTDRFILTLSPMAALGTLTFSSTYHTLMNHSPFVSASCLLIDYTGILALILASFLSGIYVGFYDSPPTQHLYWSMILALTFISALLTLHPHLQGPVYRSHRTAAFILTALSGLAPVFHGLCLYGAYEGFHYRGVKWWLIEGAWYGVGAAVFAKRWPEKWVWENGDKRGRFDVWGSSHQIFHVCVVLGAAVHCWGVWSAWRGAVEGFGL